ncbi:hypothetical protein E2C01_100025 [Portunus trituberculatus]|uniref:Uncharacterized protein n=1 Tax=Portunus trituberculatus TaxID=210409 RepID=A0A5B7KC89_PORTR|nr:hypothetical protein [Portunus trituberculatus]
MPLNHHGLCKHSRRDLKCLATRAPPQSEARQGRQEAGGTEGGAAGRGGGTQLAAPLRAPRFRSRGHTASQLPRKSHLLLTSPASAAQHLGVPLTLQEPHAETDQSSVGDKTEVGGSCSCAGVRALASGEAKARRAANRPQTSILVPDRALVQAMAPT